MSAILSFITPYEFSPTVLLACVLAGGLFIRGMILRRQDHQRTGFWRSLSFLLGLGLIYLVMQTRIDYWSQHMFWVHRLQHLVLHHLGPFLIVLAVPHQIIASGLPTVLQRRWLAPLWHHPLIQGIYRTLQQPVIASFLFVGLIYFWLIPSVHFDAMLSQQRYLVMNWSMVLDGLLFWWLILDPRPDHAVGRLGFGGRIVILSLIVPPQIIIGAHIALARESLYPVYNVCGRAWPISPLVDQQIAGLVTWIPTSMMSVIAMLIVLRRWMHERTREPLPVNREVIS
jgi:putative membrane protein